MAYSSGCQSHDENDTLLRVQEATHKCSVAWRLLLRCVWKCLLAERQSANGLRVPDRSHGDSRSQHSPTSVTSRRVYREVLVQHRQRTLAATSDSGTTNSTGSSRLPVSFQTSASFVVLRGSVVMMRALVFVRMLHYLVLVSRAQRRRADAHHTTKRLRCCLAVWRNAAAESIRKKRWTMRRVVDHWWTIARRRASVRSTVRRFVAEVHQRAVAGEGVRREAQRRYFSSWRQKYIRTVVTRKLAQRCDVVLQHKEALCHEFQLRRELDMRRAAASAAATDDDDRSTDGDGAESHSRLRWRCFTQWKRRATQRLEHRCADYHYRDALRFKAWRRWKAQLLALVGEQGSARNSGDAGYTSSAATVQYFSTIAAAPTMVAYKLKGYVVERRRQRCATAWARWKHAWLHRVADYTYVRCLRLRAIARWLHAAALRCATRRVTSGIFAHWKSRWLVNERLRHAAAWYTHKRLWGLMQSWRLEARRSELARSREKRCLRSALGTWCTAWRIRWFRASVRNRLLVQNALRLWRERFAVRERRNTASLVAEALCEHVALLSTFRHWKQRTAVQVQEKRREAGLVQALDFLRSERLCRRLLLRWRTQALEAPMSRRNATVRDAALPS